MPSDPKQFFETLRRFRDKLVPKPDAPKQVLPPVPEKQVEPKEAPPFPAGSWIPTDNPGIRFQVISTAAKALRIIQIQYKGNTYQIEPYSLRMVGGGTVDGKRERALPSEKRKSRSTLGPVQMLYGFCTLHITMPCKKHLGPDTHSFHFHAIEAVRVTEETFKPRNGWIVEF